LGAGQAIVAYALLGGKKVRLNRGLRQRMEQVAYDKWLAEAIEDSAEERLGRIRVSLLSAKPPNRDSHGRTRESDAKKCPTRRKNRTTFVWIASSNVELVEHGRMILAEWNEVECKGCGKIL
jgi:hypothetical protein